MKKEHTFKINNYNCNVCNNNWLYLGKEEKIYSVEYVCKCANCGGVVMLPSMPLVLAIKEHLREVRRNEDNN